MVNKNTKRESKEIYISTDIEMNGPIPGEYSMLSLGAVAFSPTGKILGRFYEKLKPLTGAKEHPDVMSFWGENPLAYKEATSNQKSPEKVMESYVYWVEKLSQKHKSFPIFLGWPLTLDYLFTYWYMVKFVKRLQKLHPFEIPFSFNKAIDVNSFVMAHLKKSYLRSTKI
ncbi:hypothetical protein HYT24_02505, partial [Candidatus Pacearchaeota archaeon]|nr:hypothetical protein [Candidatus Pacearchaeota archaeon]